jgi:endonuclease/exonuclease/phosphatase family metal-dependent hydrolase
VVYNAHFDHIGVEARRKSIVVIGEHIEKFFPAETIIFIGDLNFTDDDPAYETVRSFNFSDARDQVKPYGPKATFNNFSWEEIPKNRIDYIFLRGDAEVKSFAVLTDSRYNRYPSDHFPVLIHFSLD